MPGVWRARSLVCENKKHTRVVTTVTPVAPDIPRAMVYGLSRALVSGKSARMCKRAVLAKPPVAGSEPVTPQTRQSLYQSEGQLR